MRAEILTFMAQLRQDDQPLVFPGAEQRRKPNAMMTRQEQFDAIKTALHASLRIAALRWRRGFSL